MISSPPPSSSFGGRMERTSQRFAKQSGFSLSGRREQPHFKLHGSHNWLASRSSGLPFDNGEVTRPRTSMNHRCLPGTAQSFAKRSISSNARLMIIGYSFSDPHINQVLVDAAKAGAKFC
jgi:hypothetical protein